MRSSLRRYLLVRVALPALVLNIAINAVIGAVVFPAAHDVPVLGLVSACADTLVSSFFIGFLTMIGVASQARFEARAGRVQGFGSRRWWLAWSLKHVFASAIALGAIWFVLFGLPAAAVLQARWSGAMPRDVFLVFKVAFAAIFGVLAALVAAARGLAAEGGEVESANDSP
jgi:hypothetical protein